jgi:hypothetical protein
VTRGLWMPKWALTQSGPIALCLCVMLFGCSNLIGADDIEFRAPEEACTGDACDEGRIDCEDPDDCKLCRGESCVRLRNDDIETPGTGGECQQVLGASDWHPGAKTFLFGAFSSIRDPTNKSPLTLSYELALEEFASRGGVPVQDEDRHPMAVVCNVAGISPEELDRTFDHLVDELGVPAIITPLPGIELKRSFERLRARGRRVFFLSPYESDSLLTNVDDDGLLWHITGNSTDVGQAYLPLFERAQRHVGPRADGLRVALMDSNLASQSDMGAVVHAGIEFNGKPASDNDSMHYLRLRLESAQLDKDASVTDAFLRLLDFKPDIVVATGGEEFLLRVWQPLERTLSALPPEDARPFYVLSPYHAAERTDLTRILKEVPDLRTRTLGVNVAAAANSMLYDEYISVIKAAYPDDAMWFDGSENFYDSVYYLLYAVAATRNAPRLTGKEIATGMLQLLDGAPATVGADQIPAVKAMLAVAGGKVALEGTLGPPDFDASAGARRGTGSVWCVDEDLVHRFDVLRYDAGSKGLTGTFPCFDFPDAP